MENGALMIAVGILLSIVVVMLPGFLAVRLLRNRNLSTMDALLYAVGLGVLFNIVVGLVSNFTVGIGRIPVIVVYFTLLVALGIISWKFGTAIDWKWRGWKPLIVPLALYAVAVLLQYQTSLMSVNLVGSDIHLEYYQANAVLQNGYWNPLQQGSAMNAVLGITMFLPVIKLMSGLELLWVFKAVSPLIFAVLPVALYRIYKDQFGALVSVLSVVFFVTMPMFTMDMTQLIRQQQSEVFFVLAVLALVSKNLQFKPMLIVSVLFGIGAVVTHYGLSLGFIGYYLVGAVVFVLVAKYWQKGKVEWKPILSKSLMMLAAAIIIIVAYFGFYSVVNKGDVLYVAEIPVSIIGDTAQQTIKGLSESETPKTSDSTPTPDIPKSDSTPTPDIPKSDSTPTPDIPKSDSTPTTDVPKISDSTPATNAPTIDGTDKDSLVRNPLLEKFPFLNPLIREPLLQTAVGLDFGKASIYGKIWRILQYLVEICLVVGLVAFLKKRDKAVSGEFASLVVTSAFVVAGMYLLTTYSYGMGASRVWQVTLLFMSPLLVVGAIVLGRLFTGFRKIGANKLIAYSALVLLVPYSVFNLGVMYEVAKMQPSGFVDVPYSIALSGWRVDIATVFEKEDIEALDWLENRVKSINDERILFGDTHTARLMAQRFGWFMLKNEKNELYIFGNIRSLEYLYLNEDISGYIFLSKRNVETNTITYQAEYASRVSHNIDELPLLKEKLESGVVLFDNGARIILVE